MKPIIAYDGRIEFLNANGEWEDLTAHVTPRSYILHLRVDMTAHNRALDRLRYPPKEPVRGSTSRRRMKLRKAGLLR